MDLRHRRTAGFSLTTSSAKQHYAKHLLSITAFKSKLPQQRRSQAPIFDIAQFPKSSRNDLSACNLDYFNKSPALSGISIIAFSLLQSR
jgi:hypothetical protein